MYHNYNPVSGSVTIANKTPTGFAPVLKTGTAATPTFIPPYTPSTGGIQLFNPSNKIRSLQDFFKNGSGLPVFLRGPRDVIMYKGVMAFSVLGIALTLFSVARMATGKIHKKQTH